MEEDTFSLGRTVIFNNAQGKQCIVILDDLLNDVYSKEVCDLFTKGSHHGNISGILITLNLFHQGRYCLANWGMGLIFYQAKPRWTRRE